MHCTLVEKKSQWASFFIDLAHDKKKLLLRASVRINFQTYRNFCNCWFIPAHNSSLINVNINFNIESGCHYDRGPSMQLFRISYNKLSEPTINGELRKPCFLILFNYNKLLEVFTKLIERFLQWFVNTHNKFDMIV